MCVKPGAAYKLRPWPGAVWQGPLPQSLVHMARKRKSTSAAVKGWHVVVTGDNCEFEAKRELSKAGFEVEMPMIRAREFNRLGVRKVSPLFEGYVFIRESDQYWRVRGTRGVSHVLVICERPAVLADDELQFFLTMSVDDNGYYIDPVQKLFTSGDYAVPRSGRFAGCVGKITTLNRDGGLKMLFSMLGRKVSTEEYRVTELA